MIGLSIKCCYVGKTGSGFRAVEKLAQAREAKKPIDAHGDIRQAESRAKVDEISRKYADDVESAAKRIKVVLGQLARFPHQQTLFEMAYRSKDMTYSVLALSKGRQLKNKLKCI